MSEFTDALDDIRAALLVLYAEIDPHADRTIYRTQSQGIAPYWSTAMLAYSDPEPHTGIYTSTLTVQCTYVAGSLTEDAESLVTRAEDVLAAGVMLFKRRPFLQSTTVPSGVEAINADGVRVVNAAVVRIDGNAPQLAVQFTLSIPLLFETDSEDF